MDIHFLGGATTVTGSQFLLSTQRARVLIDCGLFQGSPNESIRNRVPFGFDPGSLDAVVLTHAHLDHCGLLPLLVREGFPGAIHATAGTVELATLVLLATVIVLALARSGPHMALSEVAQRPAAAFDAGRVVVLSTQSIAAALLSATAGTTIVVDPGEYRETLMLKSYVRLVSRVRHGAVIRLPGSASEGEAAIVARDVIGAAVEGFRIIGDAATPLGTGVAVTNAQLSIADVEITGAGRAAIAVDPASSVSLLGNDIRDNSGAALAIQSGANATVSHNVFMRNGSAGGRKAMIVEEPGGPLFIANVFVGMSPDVLAASPDARAALARDNWFVDAPAPAHRVIRSRPATR